MISLFYQYVSKFLQTLKTLPLKLFSYRDDKLLYNINLSITLACSYLGIKRPYITDLYLDILDPAEAFRPET